jgi:hypothetical protein
LFFWGHGLLIPKFTWDLLGVFGGMYVGVGTDTAYKDKAHDSYYSSWQPHYTLGLGILFACGTEAAKNYTIFSKNAKFWGSPGLLLTFAPLK